MFETTNQMNMREYEYDIYDSSDGIRMQNATSHPDAAASNFWNFNIRNRQHLLTHLSAMKGPLCQRENHRKPATGCHNELHQEVFEVNIRSATLQTFSNNPSKTGEKMWKDVKRCEKNFSGHSGTRFWNRLPIVLLCLLCRWMFNWAIKNTPIPSHYTSWLKTFFYYGQKS